MGRVTLHETSLLKALPYQANSMVTWAKHNSFGFLTISPVYPENMNPDFFSGDSESSLSTVPDADFMQVLPSLSSSGFQILGHLCHTTLGIF